MILVYYSSPLFYSFSPRFLVRLLSVRHSGARPAFTLAVSLAGLCFVSSGRVVMTGRYLVVHAIGNFSLSEMDPPALAPTIGVCMDRDALTRVIKLTLDKNQRGIFPRCWKG